MAGDPSNASKQKGRNKSAATASESDPLTYRRKQKQSIYERQKGRLQKDVHAKETAIDPDDAVACMAVHTGLTAEQVASPAQEDLTQIYAKFAHIVNDLEVASSRLLQAGDMRTFSRLNERSKHCVRCHKEYTQVQNGPKACFVRHGDGFPDPELGDRNKGEDLEEWIYYCNGESEWVDAYGASDHKYCFVGAHTTKVGDVRYTDDILAELYDLNDSGREEEEQDADQIRPFPTCKQAGCDSFKAHSS